MNAFDLEVADIHAWVGPDATVGTVEYFNNEWRELSARCDCGWDISQSRHCYEVFDDLFEVHCPRCDHKFVNVLHPTRGDIEQAAAAGDEEAIGMLASIMKRETARPG